MKKRDVIVVGLGAHGAATTWRLAQRGLSVLGIDRFHPPHSHGSSHGETRITRLAVGEGDDYAPLARRSHELWRQLEAETGERVMFTTGGLVLGKPSGGMALHGRADFVGKTIDMARRLGIAHEVLDARAVAARFPAFSPAPDEVGYFEPEAGLLVPERCIAAQLRLARARGAELRFGEAALAIEPAPGGMRVRTAAGAYEAERVVAAVGGWAPGLLGAGYRERLRLHQQKLFWFAATDPGVWRAGTCPVFIWVHGRGQAGACYGFPISPVSADGGVKIAEEQFEATLAAPEDLEPVVDPRDGAAMFEAHAAGRLRGLDPNATRAAACLYTTAPGSRFVIETHRESERLTVISACSGHGFKHSAAIGEAVATWLAAGERPAVLAPFNDHG